MQVGETLKTLRVCLGLSLGEVSREAEVPHASLRDWESGRYVPSGPTLARVLSALQADANDRARLLALASPRQARLELAHTTLGAPVCVGQVLRGLRLRTRTTQSEAAKRLGLGQSAFAKWESGDSVPSDQLFQRALLALGASEAEISAVAIVGKTASSIPEDLELLEARLNHIAEEVPLALMELYLLGLEYELWWRSTREPAALALLCRTLSIRAHGALFFDDPTQVASLAARSAALAKASGSYSEASRAVFASCWHRQRTGRDPKGAAKALRSWRERLKSQEEIDWLRTSEALAMVRAGAADEGIAILRSIEERVLRESGPVKAAYFQTDLVDANLLAGRTGSAVAVLESMGEQAPLIAQLRVSVATGTEPEKRDLDRYIEELNPHNRVESAARADLERGLAQMRRRKVRNAS